MSYLKEKNFVVDYIYSNNQNSDIRNFLPSLMKDGIEEVHFIDPVDFYLSKRIKEGCVQNNIKYVEYESPSFLNSIKIMKIILKWKKII